LDLYKRLNDPQLCQSLIRSLANELSGPFRFMEVCGTHTVAIFQSGLRSMLPPEIIHVSGPGCPVCVTHESEVAAFLEAADRPGVILATFGDLMRVPGPGGRSLKMAQAEGARIKVVYSPIDSLKIARENPGDKVVFLGVGFETTAPTVAATLKVANKEGIANFSVLSFHKLVPPAMQALVGDPEIKVEGFLLPGHVSAIIGLEPYRFIARDYGIPAVIGGFEPVDILQSLLIMVRQRNEGRAEVINNYRRIVADEGNARAREVMGEVFTPADALWRGIGMIPGSGLKLSEGYAGFDALQTLEITLKECPPPKGCRCGEVLKGIMSPDQCPLFRKVCTPASAVGPCMVSTEGSCAAYYKYKI
jgi:hydrogenase expression/formation protein HypD